MCPIPIRSFSSWKVATFLVVAGLIHAPTPSRADDEAEPPAVRTYSVRVLELETGAPVVGITIRVRENLTTWHCYRMENGICTDCHSQQDWQIGHVTTGPDGTGSVDFTLPWCAIIDDDPPTWIKRDHLSWAAPEVVERPAEGVFSPWILARYETGPSPFKHTIYVTREERLAERFAPVFHAHRELERQEGLGNMQETLDAHARLEVFNVLGQRVYGPSSMPPYHVWDEHFWDTYGRGTVPIWPRIDIDDDWRYRAGSTGNRPLYYHVFPYAEGAVVQYWLWFNCNDTGGHEESSTMHEGDWEYVALYLTFDGSEWTPQVVNFSQHAGGQSLPAADVWWSRTAEPNYFDLQPGYAPGRTHPHVWVAANSHALYSRFQPQYELAIDVLGCQAKFADRVDYNIGGNPHGAFAYFEWDRLVDMGEYWTASEAHGETYFWHTMGGPLQWLAFQGRFGESLCADLPGCDLDCDFPPYEERSWAPKSPLIYEAPHKWREFQAELGRWGNGVPSGAEVSWKEARLIGNVLGQYSPCVDGSGDVIHTQIPNAPAGIPGVVEIHVVSGSVSFPDAVDGRLTLPASSDGWYELRVARVEGSGTVRFDVYPQGQPGSLLARDLVCDIRPCGTSALPERLDRGVASSVRIHPNPTRRGARFDFSAVPREYSRWSLHDAAGRRIAGGALPTRTAKDGRTSSSHADGSTVVEWPGTAMDGRPVASGVYFLRVEGAERSHPAGSVTVMR